MKYLPVLAFGIFGLAVSSCNPPQKEQIDHIILAVNNLESGMNQFRELTGVMPVVGGIHPHSFTQNALVSLGNKTYLEILAPRTDVDSIPDWFMKLDSLTPYGWAVRTSNIDQTRLKLKEHNVVTLEPNAGSRQTPQGNLLQWTSFGLESAGKAPVPFFINWHPQSAHPSESAPTGCTLNKLGIVSNHKDLSILSEELELGFELVKGEPDKLIIVIDSPKGRIRFE